MVASSFPTCSFVKSCAHDHYRTCSIVHREVLWIVLGLTFGQTVLLKENATLG